MSDDLISRKDVMDLILEWSDGYSYVETPTENALKAVESLPSVEPERKKGRWVPDGKGFYACTSCGEPWSHWWAVVVSPDRIYKELRFCPHCGAEMEL